MSDVERADIIEDLEVCQYRWRKLSHDSARKYLPSRSLIDWRLSGE